MRLGISLAFETVSGAWPEGAAISRVAERPLERIEPACCTEPSSRPDRSEPKAPFRQDDSYLTGFCSRDSSKV